MTMEQIKLYIQKFCKGYKQYLSLYYKLTEILKLYEHPVL